jgi:metal transporter CNNM
VKEQKMAQALVPTRLQTQHNGGIRIARVLLPLFAALASIPVSYAAPLLHLAKEKGGDGEPEPKPADDPSLWLYLGTAVGLVVMGGIFAGLTIAYVFPLLF